MSSRSATVLVIFVVACIAFCLASVFGAMTGPISILPNESDSGSVLDNLSAITDSDGDYESYGSEDTNDYSSDYNSYDNSQSEPQVETTTDDSGYNQQSESQVETTTDEEPQETPQVETTTDDGEN